MSTTPEAQRLASILKIAGQNGLAHNNGAGGQYLLCATEAQLVAFVEAISARAQPPAPPVPAQPVGELTDERLEEIYHAVYHHNRNWKLDFARAVIEEVIATRSVPEVPVAPSELSMSMFATAKDYEFALAHQAVPSAMDACDSAESGQEAPDDSDLVRLVFEAIGYASMCWKPKPGEQVFDTDKATKCAEQLIADVRNLYAPILLGQKGRAQAAKTAGSDDKRAALTESILTLGTVEQTAPVIGLLVAYIESLAVAEGSE